MKKLNRKAQAPHVSWEALCFVRNCTPTLSWAGISSRRAPSPLALSHKGRGGVGSLRGSLRGCLARGIIEIERQFLRVDLRPGAARIASARDVDVAAQLDK